MKKLRELENYRKFTRTTAIYSGACTGNKNALSYLGLGLSSEAGEVAGKLSKLLYRDGNIEEAINATVSEMGDTLWFLVRLCDELDISLEDLIEQNTIKLADRKKRNKIKGNGDNR